MQTQTIAENQSILSVSMLNREVRTLLEKNLSIVWVEGELSNFAAPHSGHWYFSLKDNIAQVRCAMFRLHQKKVKFIPKDGLHVLVKARVSLYETRGEFQLTIEDMEERGEGKLQQAFLAMQKKLNQLGLFAPEHKKPIPKFPNTIGIITSATGAAIRDILNALKRRYTHAPIIVYPTLVQGTGAAENIVKAIQIADRRQECDVLILARGGGSLEDLWPFNEEIVAHAIFSCRIPLVSGVGHEVDTTIADFVADLRASTPTAAAEVITPDRRKLLEQITHQHQQLLHVMKRQLTLSSEKVTARFLNLNHLHPKNRLLERQQWIDEHEYKLKQLFMNRLQGKRMQLLTFERQLQAHTPKHPLNRKTQLVKDLQQHLQGLMKEHLYKMSRTLAEKGSHLHALSPLATLERGYAIAETETHKIVKDSSTLVLGEKIRLQLAKGHAHCKVIKVD